MEKVPNRDAKGFGTDDRKWSLNDGQIPNFHGVRVARTEGYNRVKGGARERFPLETPNVRFAFVWGVA
jgi:hypothetical protein